MIPEVVNVKKCKDFGTRPGDVYIGRRNDRYGFKESPWENPFGITQESQRDISIALYKIYIEGLLASGRLSLESLKDARRLGCWCKPKNCHGDVIVELLEKDVRP